MRILIADDDIINRRLLEVGLAKWGYEVVSTRDGDEAWAALQREDAPNLVILDWMMPGMDGVEVCRKVRSSPGPRLFYIILLTGKDQREDIVRGLQAGADDYMVKPFDRQELQTRVQVGVRMLGLQDRLAQEARDLEAEHQQMRHYRDLALERERFDAAVSAMSDGIIVTDGNHRLANVNPSACTLLSIPPDAWEGLSLDSVLQPFTLSIPSSDLHIAAPAGKAFEISSSESGKSQFLAASVTHVVDGAGNVESALLTVRDITEERRVQNARSDFFLMLSYRLKQPLNILVGYLDLAKQIPPENMMRQLSQVLGVCDQETQRLEQTVSKLLDFRRLSAEQLEAEARPTEVAAVVEIALNEIRARHPSRQIEAKADIEPAAAYVDAATEHMQFVLGILLDNAVKFSQQDPAHIRIKAERLNGEGVRIGVGDDGPGIPRDRLDHILESLGNPDHAVEPNGSVPAVGLHMARQVVRAYGGELSVQSSPGDGSVFSFTLPAV